jgi:hypothetical protein
MGLTTILSNRSIAVEGFYFRPTFNSTIISGNFTSVFVVPAEHYYEIQLFRLTISGTHSIRLTLGFDTSNPYYQQTFSTPNVGFEFNQWNSNGKFILPAGTILWVDARAGGGTHVLTIAGTKYKVTS